MYFIDFILHFNDICSIIVQQKQTIRSQINLKKFAPHSTLKT